MFMDNPGARRCWTHDHCGFIKKHIPRVQNEKLVAIKLKSEIPVLLPVMERFYTLQGEGFHQGRAAYFIRLGGCDVGGVWCDVKESWDADKHPRFEVRSLRLEVEK